MITEHHQFHIQRSLSSKEENTHNRRKKKELQQIIA